MTNCLHCNNEFEPKQKYCSVNCRVSAFRNGNVTEKEESNVTVTKKGRMEFNVKKGIWE